MKKFLLLLALFVPALASCESKPDPERMKPAASPSIPEGHQVATLGAGCYWCIEAAYRRLDGVHAAVSGFMGGEVEHPSYNDVCEGTTGHAEVVQVVFDPKKISYEKILSWFWELHDPTTLNRQGNDIGTQYRSAIFYHSPEQKKIAESSKQAAGTSLFKKPIVTEITAASTFYPAPLYHQDYYSQNQSKNPYCRFVIEPKLRKLKLHEE